MKLAQNILLVAFTLLLATSIAAQKRGWSETGNTTEEDRKVGDFKSVSVGGGIDLEITQGNSNTLHVIASDHAIDNLITEVKGDQLRIYFDKKVRRVKKSLVQITVDDLESIHASGGSDVEGKGVLKFDELRIDGSGGSDMELELEVEKLYVNCSGGSDIEIEGSTKYLDLNASGGSDFDGYDFEAKEVVISASGGSDSNVYASESITVNASGSSDVNFKGNPSKTKLRSSGSSDIHSHK